MSKHIQQTYQVLDEIEHVRKRTGMYAGSIASQTSEEWIYNQQTKKMERREITYIPAFIKIFSEILDNSIDEHKRAPETLDSIRVDFHDDGSISIFDNGRGIPVQIHEQTGQYIAETIFSNLRAGSNFNDDVDQQLIGTNGIGATLCNILSSNFKIESCDGKQLFKQEFWNGLRERSNPKITNYAKSFTRTTFTPDYEFFKLDSLDEDHKLKLIKKIVDAAANNTAVKFYINGDRIQIRSFSDYIALYTDEYIVDLANNDWKIGISASDTFEQISFVNAVETYQGGTHVDYVAWQIVERLREYFKKKHKVDLKPGDVRAHMRLYISANINRPKFSSQTKENMISPVSEWKTNWKVSDKFIRQLTQSSIIQAVLSWVEAKARQAELAELKKMNKDTSKRDPRRVEKFNDANERKDRHLCELYLSEGDSAAKAIQSARGKNPYIGSFALKGKPLNVTDAKVEQIVNNEEIKNLLTITGLSLGEPVKDIKDLRFGKICLMCDQDLDGFHLSSLLLNIFARFWPELYSMGVIYRLSTPLYIVTCNKEQLEFFTEEEYKDWAKQGKKHSFEYFKGLGTFETAQFKKIVENREKYLVQIKSLDHADLQKFDLAFSNALANDRKVWLQDASYFRTYD
jgi:DNA topoisomerase-2